MAHLHYSSAMYSLGSVCWLDTCDSVKLTLTDFALLRFQVSGLATFLKGFVLSLQLIHIGHSSDTDQVLHMWGLI